MAKSYSTLREQIADSLRKAIMHGELRPGERVHEVEIAERYQASRTPVREAFRKLESEGFLQIRPRRGAVVTPMTAKDISDFYELKSLLESFAAERAASNLTGEEIEKLSRLNATLKGYHSRGDFQAMAAPYAEFYEIFVRASGNDRLAALVKNLSDQFQRFHIALSHTDAIGSALEIHDHLIEAFRERNNQQARELVIATAKSGSEALLRQLALN